MTPNSPSPTFPKRDIASALFWDDRFAANFTPWDRGGVPAEFVQFVSAHSAQRILIPGCGLAYELGYLLQQGWDAFAMDFSHEAVLRARSQLPITATHRVIEADFFAPSGGQVAFLRNRAFDIVYECAFLCALPPTLREKWAAQMARLIHPGGMIVGYFFIAETASGPPFGINPASLNTLLENDFVCVENIAPANSIPVFAGNERWMRWQRR